MKSPISFTASATSLFKWGYPAWCFLLVFIALSPLAQGQFATNLSLPKTNFLSHEPLMATVTLSNRSGGDIVMTGSALANWLTFEVTDVNGRSLPSIGLAQQKPFIFKAGTTIAEKVRVSDHYGVTELGAYGITANVYHPPTKQFYTSNRLRFNVMDAKPFWEQPIGIPAGFPDAGRIRRYSLVLFRDVERSNMYFRFTDDKSAQTLATYEIGPCSVSVDPTATLDSDNKLHTLFMAMPKLYCYVIIAPDGKLKKREYYKMTETSRPAMVASGDGSVSIQGGLFFDPSAPEPAKKKSRPVSERPPGL